MANADQPGPPPLSSILVPTLALLAALLAVLTFWAMRSLTMPLRRFDSAVERFGHDAVDPVLLTEEGPAELREAARAFNRMQRRISRLVEDRTRMLAAVSHDLRTPVTRVRLHAEAISSDELRDQILANLDEMDRLLEGALVQLRDGGSSEKPVDVDLFSLVQTVVERTADCGAAVSFDGKPGGRVRGQPEALMRLFDNLIDNALKYGGSATVTLDWDASRARVRVIDHGQGIADDAKAGLLEPFTRGDCSRNRDSGSGFGLGLSIADAIARSHKGSIALEDTPGGGLTVLVTLPAQTPTV
ncbi:MAG: HAMP domain-containing protein [Rhodobiaceae bacterium]|nr:HAMP domain-containing protein [Rhodobiaceae bacterium]